MIGAVMMVRFRKTDNPLWEIVASQIIGGIGGGLTTSASQLGIQSVVPHQDVAMATAVLLAVTQVGAAIGASMSSAMWTGVLPAQLKVHLPAEQHHLIPDILGSLSYALSFEPGTPERTASKCLSLLSRCALSDSRSQSMLLMARLNTPSTSSHCYHSYQRSISS